MYHLQKEMDDLSQNSSSIATYYSKIKALWDELDTLNTKTNYSCSCDYGGKVKIAKTLQNERLMQFLMGLSEIYAPVRSNILMMSPLPSVSLVYSLLIQDEKQREISVYSHYAGDQSSFLVVDNSGPPQYTQSGQKVHTPEYRSKKGNTSLTCSHCKKPGHSVDKCFRIIGFPHSMPAFINLCCPVFHGIKSVFFIRPPLVLLWS